MHERRIARTHEPPGTPNHGEAGDDTGERPLVGCRIARKVERSHGARRRFLVRREDHHRAGSDKGARGDHMLEERVFAKPR